MFSIRNFLALIAVPACSSATSAPCCGAAPRAEAPKTMSVDESTEKGSAVAAQQVDLTCDTAALQGVSAGDHRSALLASVGKADRRELDDGFVFQIPSRSGLLAELVALIENERRCCPFFTFALRIPADGRVVELTVTGPAKSKKLIVELLAGAG